MVRQLNRIATDWGRFGLARSVLLGLLGFMVWFGQIPVLAAEPVSLTVPKWSSGQLANKPSLQRGLKLYVNYCLACHSLRYTRYRRIAADLAIPVDLLKDRLIFNPGTPDSKLQTALPNDLAKAWFGRVPPDLSNVAQVHGPDWLAGFLLGFYDDPKRPFGVNNYRMLNTQMPNVLSSSRIVLAGKAYQADPQLNAMVSDLVNFLMYVAEPERAERMRIGRFVLLFLVIWAVLSFFLHKNYWR